MIDSSGIVYKANQKRNQLIEKHTARSKDLDGDSGVGQAPEFPSKSLSHRLHLKFLPASIFSLLGTVLIALSVIGFIFTYGPVVKVELGYKLIQTFDNNESDSNGFAQLVEASLLDYTSNVPDPQFSIIIPKIHARSKIIAAVDPSDAAVYSAALKTGVAHARGTKFPGQAGNIYLFAHSTDSPFNAIRFNAVFYLLKELTVRDEIDIFYQGAKHKYLVTDRKIVDPKDVSLLTADNSEKEEQLILQTCYPPGTRQKRLLILAKKFAENPNISDSD